MNSQFYPFGRATNQFCSVPGLDGWPSTAFLCIECLVCFNVRCTYILCQCMQLLTEVVCCTTLNVFRSLDQRVIASTFCHSKSCTQLDIYFVVVVVGITHNNSVHLPGSSGTGSQLVRKDWTKSATAQTTRVQSGICHTIQSHASETRRTQKSRSGPSFCEPRAVTVHYFKAWNRSEYSHACFAYRPGLSCIFPVYS